MNKITVLITLRVHLGKARVSLFKVPLLFVVLTPYEYSHLE